MNIDGIPIEVRKKKIKNLHIRINAPDGAVTVSAPRGMSDAEIERFVRSRLGWIRGHRSEAQSRSFRPSKEFIADGAIWLWGRRYALGVRRGEAYSLSVADGGALLTAVPGGTEEELDAFVREWSRARLCDEIGRRMPEWERVTGLKASEWRIKNMTTRWGTCNTAERRVWLSLQLVKRPPECLDYVILHELLHLTERGHNRRFYALMDRYMPDWRERRSALNGF